MGMSGSSKKSRSVVPQQQQTSCYQRYTLVLVGLGLGSLLVYIYYTDHIQYAVLPRLKAGVKRTVCSMMKLPCPEYEYDWTAHRETLVGIASRGSTAERIHRKTPGLRNKISEAGPRGGPKNAGKVSQEHQPALRVRSRYPSVRFNRGRGIGPIPTWAILQKIKNMKSRIFSKEKEASKYNKWLAQDLNHPKLVSTEDIKVWKTHGNQNVRTRENGGFEEIKHRQTQNKGLNPVDNEGSNLPQYNQVDGRESSSKNRYGQNFRRKNGRRLAYEHKQPKGSQVHQPIIKNVSHEKAQQNRHLDMPRLNDNTVTARHWRQHNKPKHNGNTLQDLGTTRSDKSSNQRENANSTGDTRKKNPGFELDKSTEIPYDNADYRDIHTKLTLTKRKQSLNPNNVSTDNKKYPNILSNVSSKNPKSSERFGTDRQSSNTTESNPISKPVSNIKDKNYSHVAKLNNNGDQRDSKEVMKSGQKIPDSEGQRLGQSRGTAAEDTLSLGPEWNGKSLKAFLADRTPYSIQMRHEGGTPLFPNPQLEVGRPASPSLSKLLSLLAMSDYDYLQQHLLSGGLNLTLMSNQRWPEEMRFDYRELYLDPPLKDINQAASHVTSHVVLLEPRPEYTVGEVLKLRVDVYNGNGDALKRGGDEVRVWLVERSKGASLAGIVTDLNNGSYLAQVKLQWTGVQKIQVELTFSREALRAHDYIRHVTKVMRYVAGGFSKDAISEATLCSPFPAIPGYNQLCNYTHPVYGLSWYCGKPRKPELHCADWVSIRDMEFLAPLPLTQAEKELLERLRKPPHLRLIPAATSLSVHVTSGRAQMPDQPCSRSNSAGTWNLGEPRGFMLHGHWIRTDCATGRVDAALESNCLANTTLTFAGDSTLLQFFTDLIPRTGCTLVESHSQNWHRPRACVRPDTGFQMSWALHGYPVHPVSDHWALRTDFREVTDLLDAIPADKPVDGQGSNGAQQQTGSNIQQQKHQLLQQPPQRQRHVVLITLYIHLSIHHIHVFGERLRVARRAVERLLERSPSTLVLVRGPHTAYYGWPPHLGGDMMGPVMRKMIVEEFRSLRDKIVYLDFWDMTVAMENSNFHPDPAINTAMLNAMLHHVCAKR